MRNVAAKYFALFFIILAGAAFLFYFKYFKGLEPVIRRPPVDIKKLIKDAQNKGSSKDSFSDKAALEKPSKSSSAKPKHNQTGMPLKLPEDFSISVFTSHLGTPRVLETDPGGRIIATLTKDGKIVALPDEDLDGVADRTIVILEGLDRPHGLAFQCKPGTSGLMSKDCKMYISESGQISVYNYDSKLIQATNRLKIADLPAGGNHFTRSIGIGPDNRLYVTIGSSCDVCVERDSRRAKIYSMNLDGSDFKEFARGLRNSVFFKWNPIDGKMWADDMGRDMLGDDLPPDEVNIIEQGKDYGWPYCYGKKVHDNRFDQRGLHDCSGTEASKIDLQAHSAPLGMAFVPEEGWPAKYRNNLLIAYHGSWNRSVPTGYKIVMLKLGPNSEFLGIEDFITGWLTNSGALGRPVDLLIRPGGILYVSDDKAGVIYKVIYDGLGSR